MYRQRALDVYCSDVKVEQELAVWRAISGTVTIALPTNRNNDRSVLNSDYRVITVANLMLQGPRRQTVTIAGPITLTGQAGGIHSVALVLCSLTAAAADERLRQPGGEPASCEAARRLSGKTLAIKEKKMREFLSAKWVNLILISYQIDPAILAPYLPTSGQVDTYQGKTFVSLVAFQFRDTRIMNWKIPFHVNFPEVNLRFYGTVNGQRGAIFLKELVPKPIVAYVAKMAYNEPYYYCAIKDRVSENAEDITAIYSLQKGGHSFMISAKARNQPFTPPKESLEHFLKEHCRGYGKTRDGRTLAYTVSHTVWPIYPIEQFHSNIDYGFLYGPEWAFLNNQEPYNLTFAEGSTIKVYSPFVLDQKGNS
jgi:uncharacterized protein YqjF (DUF2071 family)